MVSPLQGPVRQPADGSPGMLLAKSLTRFVLSRILLAVLASSDIGKSLDPLVLKVAVKNKKPMAPPQMNFRAYLYELCWYPFFRQLTRLKSGANLLGVLKNLLG